MKASERKKNKFKAIKEILEMIRLHKNKIRFFYPLRNEKGTLARYNFEETIEKLHRGLFALRAMEKQIPMLPVIKVKTSRVHKHQYSNAYQPTAWYKRMIDVCCRNCGDVLNENAFDEELKYNWPKYCPNCGQKLWWNR